MSNNSFLELFAEDAAYRRWFKRWWKADYSMEGFSKRKEAPRAFLEPATVTFAGRTWRVGHAPPHDLSGNPNPHFSFLRVARINRHSQYGAPVDLSGLFLPETALDLQVSRITGTNFISTGSLTIRSTADILHLSFDEAIVSGRLAIENLPSLELALNRIECVQLALGTVRSGQATLLGCKISEDAQLPTQLRSLTIESSSIGAASQGNRSVIEILKIENTTFNRRLALGTELSLPTPSAISNCTFKDGLHLLLSKGKELSLNGVRVAGEFVMDVQDGILSLDHVASQSTGTVRSAGGTVEDSNGKWGADLILQGAFKRARFRRSALAKGISGSQCEIGQLVLEDLKAGSLDIRSSELGGVSIDRSAFIQPVALRGCSFTLFLSCRDSSFQQGADFGAQGASPALPKARNPDIANATISRCKFGAGGDGNALRFSGRTFSGHTEFLAITVAGIPHFERSAFKEAVSFLDTKFLFYDAAPPAPLSWLEFTLNPWLREAARPRSLYLERAERAFSGLKDAMCEAGALRLEKTFHVLEMRARRGRWDADVDQGERAISYLYDKFALYGESIKRPLLFLLLIPILFSLLYYIISTDRSSTGLLHSLDFSLQQEFRPFFIWNPAYADGSGGVSWVQTHLFGSSIGRELTVKMLAFLESTLTLSLTFLLALAIRRRFQIS